MEKGLANPSYNVQAQLSQARRVQSKNTEHDQTVDDRESPGHDRDFLGENFPRCMRGAQLPYSRKDPKLIIINE